MSRDASVDISVSCSIEKRKKPIKHKTIVRITAAASIQVNSSFAGWLLSSPRQDVKAAAAVQPHCSLMCATLAAAANAVG